MNKTATAILLALVISAVAAVAYRLGRSHSEPARVTASAPEGRRVLFYRSPMNPSVTSPAPAKDEMGMDYVAVYADGGNATVAGTVTIDPATVQDIGVRTAVAERRVLARTVRTVGRVDYDEQGFVHLNLRSDGWVERLQVAETGQSVRRGQPLLELYSPQIVSSEQEYRLALQGVAALGADAPTEIAEQARALRDSSAERLRLLGVPDSERRRLQQGGPVRHDITVTAPASGVVQSIGAREGQFVAMQTEVYRIADLSTVWVLADLYEDDVPWVKQGDHADVQLRGMPGRTFSAQVDYVYPYLESRTRTQEVRLKLRNADGRLKPGMYADVTFHGGHQVEAVAVPESAIIRSGTRTQVFVVAAAGHFEPREVSTGVAADGYVQILDGLQGGERVVVSSEFLIDSESRLREATAKLIPPARVSPSPPANSSGVPASPPPATSMQMNEQSSMPMDDASRAKAAGRAATPMPAAPPAPVLGPGHEH